MEKTGVTIIGAGVVGLAIAAEIADIVPEAIIVEKHPAFGQETSSRNSEVIHAGIYYEKDSLKARLCIKGNQLLYQLCQTHHIPHKRTGKLIVAAKDEDVEEIEGLLAKGKDNGVQGLELISSNRIRQIEPNINAIAGLWSPNTGIIDTHSLMKYLEFSAKEKGVTLAYGCEVTAIEKRHPGYKLDIREANGESFSFLSRLVINSAGLFSDRIAALAGIDIDTAGYRLHYCKGEYFRLGGGKHKLIHHLIYPPPTSTGLGIHTVLDLHQRVRLGPNAFYVDGLNYEVEEAHKRDFLESVRQILPFVQENDLNPDMAGIRPKLQGPARDFVIRHEEDKELSGFINLIGIESPGLTASLAIAQYVRGLIKEIMSRCLNQIALNRG